MRKWLTLVATVFAIVAIGFTAVSASATSVWEPVNVTSSPFTDTMADGTVVTITFGTGAGYWGSTHTPALYKTDATGGGQNSFVRFSFSRPVTSLKTYYAYLGVGDDEKFTTDLGPVNLAQTFANGGNLVSSTGSFITGQPAGTYSISGIVSSTSGDRSATLELQFATGVNWLEVTGFPPSASGAGINLTGLELAIGLSTVTFDANNGSGSMPAQTSAIVANLSNNSFTRSGYSFSGWNTVANGTGTAYANGASYLFNSDTTLYAQWTANSVTPTPASPVLAETGSHTGFLLPLGLSLVFLGFSSLILTRRARN